LSCTYTLIKRWCKFSFEILESTFKCKFTLLFFIPELLYDLGLKKLYNSTFLMFIIIWLIYQWILLLNISSINNIELKFTYIIHNYELWCLNEIILKWFVRYLICLRTTIIPLLMPKVYHKMSKTNNVKSYPILKLD